MTLGDLEWGSSPRVRGKRPRRALPLWRYGLIPACAGKTTIRPSACIALSAHPRVCGENRNSNGMSSPACGSSPRVRGKLDRLSMLRGRQRLIPACAGKTISALFSYFFRWAHPRVCGENKFCPPMDPAYPGSSPRVRGKQGSCRGRCWFVRLIPACAGKTHGSAPGSADSAAHPRVCGENAPCHKGQGAG